MTRPVTDEQAQRGLLVALELKESTDRLAREGFNFYEIAAGIACHANDVIKAKHNQATASAWFLGMAKHAAIIAGAEMGFKPDSGTEH